ncbi:MAG TPA: class I poly(R)-hydroxyalkanoic acid synthase [Burkholderiales bacterium]|nr:class I poly(R)-hydroxyalkanoic acid synthase [Burkholderiales bacterium]
MAEDKSAAPTPASDPTELSHVLAEIALRSKHLVEAWYGKQGPAHGQVSDDLGVGKAFGELAAKMLTDPAKLMEASLRMWQEYFALWQSTLRRAMGEKSPPVAEPAKTDNRFRSELWQNSLVFDYIKQSYLIAAQSIQEAVAGVGGLDPQTARKVRFFTRQYVDALAPTNFLLTNPEVIKTTLETGGRNLLDGLNHLLQDLDRGHGKLAISMTDTRAFRLGENVAGTPGKVVFENDLMQLIQYAPTTQTVQRTPLLIVPPWINKYYILDLRQKNSFIRFALDQGITVFVVSWVNPDRSLSGKTFDDYMLEGPLAAFGAMQKATGEQAFNVIGYCLGGTLTAATLAWMAARGDHRVRSVTFFTTLIDFSEPGELGVFVDEETVGNLEKKMQERGYLEGAEMAATFNMLRANDLIWSFVVNNYLLGKEPFPFDLLYWNSDATRMPPRMHTYYLRNMYIRNGLREPGCLSLAGTPIDLSKVTIPAYFISTVEDHIAPWKTTYLGALLLRGPVRFVLGGSGHIAGIVNPPAANKYWFWTNDALRATADEWLTTARKHEGSWWNDWAKWVSGFGGEQVPARTPGDGSLPVIEDAPGRYAKLRLDQQDAKPPAAEPAGPRQATPRDGSTPVRQARGKPAG